MARHIGIRRHFEQPERFVRVERLPSVPCPDGSRKVLEQGHLIFDELPSLELGDDMQRKQVSGRLEPRGYGAPLRRIRPIERAMPIQVGVGCLLQPVAPHVNCLCIDRLCIDRPFNNRRCTDCLCIGRRIRRRCRSTAVVLAPHRNKQQRRSEQCSHGRSPVPFQWMPRQEAPRLERLGTGLLPFLAAFFGARGRGAGAPRSKHSVLRSSSMSGQ